MDPESHVEWRREPTKAISHVVITDADKPGGQWTRTSVEVGWDIGALSYSEMLSLPCYSFAQHYRKQYGAKAPDFERPDRAQVANYFAAYPSAVGISDTLWTSTRVVQAARSQIGFSISLADGRTISCRHLVLGTGIYTRSIPPPSLFLPLTDLHDQSSPLLVIGSGFSAADAIVSTSRNRKIIHVYRWNPDERPSPLRGCHYQAYPEYAGVYRQMKLATVALPQHVSGSPLQRTKSSSFANQRDWMSVYEGLANAEVEECKPISGGGAEVRIRLESGESIWREVGELAYVVGRRGSLSYLSPELYKEVLDQSDSGHSNGASTFSSEQISSRSLRTKAETSTEVAPNVFIIGSLTGDSLVRHEFGACIVAACCILGTCTEVKQSKTLANGTNVHHKHLIASGRRASQHQDLGVDRREIFATQNEFETSG